MFLLVPVNLLSRGTTEAIESFGVTEMLLNYITFSIFKVASKELTEPGLKNTVLECHLWRHLWTTQLYLFQNVGYFDEGLFWQVDERRDTETN